MILEAAVLLRVENLEQRRRRIAAKILAELVDLIEQEQRVRRPRLLDVRNDLAGKRADVGAPVAADFRLVADAAQRLANELAARGSRDRAAERRLADAGRADEAQDRSLELVRARLDRKIFDDPLLDLLEAVMVLVENLLRLGDILLEPGFLAPGQAEQHVEIVAGDGGLGRHRRHRAKLLQLRIGAGAGLLRKPGLADLLGELLKLVAALLAFVAELALNRFELLIQIIFALRLLHLAFDAAADLLLDLEHAELALHEGEHHFEAAARIEFAQQRLLVGDLDRKVGSDRIGEHRRLFNFAKAGCLFPAEDAC